MLLSWTHQQIFVSTYCVLHMCNNTCKGMDHGKIVPHYTCLM